MDGESNAEPTMHNFEYIKPQNLPILKTHFLEDPASLKAKDLSKVFVAHFQA